MLTGLFSGAGSGWTKAAGAALALVFSGAVAAFYKAVTFTTPERSATLVERKGKLRHHKSGQPMIFYSGRNRRIPLIDVQHVITLQEYVLEFSALMVDRVSNMNARSVNWMASGSIKFVIIEEDKCVASAYYGGEGSLEGDVMTTVTSALKSVLKRTPIESDLTDNWDALLEEINGVCAVRLKKDRGIELTMVALKDDSRSQAQVMADAMAERQSADQTDAVVLSSRLAS